jgi:hypothetical protein
VALKRQALAAVRPLTQQIGYWQLTVARLISIGERARTHAGYVPTCFDELDALDRTIETQKAMLEAAVAGLPEEVRINGRIADTQRALESLATAANRARALLGSPARPFDGKHDA